MKSLKATANSPIQKKVSINIRNKLIKDCERDDLLMYHLLKNGVSSKSKKEGKCDECGFDGICYELDKVNAKLCECCFSNMEQLQLEQPELFIF